MKFRDKQRFFAALWQLSMKRLLFLLLASGIGSGLLAAAPNQLTEQEKAAGFRLIFDGKSMQGWKAFKGDAPQEGWHVVDGAITLLKAGAGDLVSEEEYADFDLRFEFRISAQGNSGVMFRVSDDAKYRATHLTGPEYQVLDPQAFEKYDHELQAGNVGGSLYGIIPTKPGFSKPADQWNAGRIMLENNRLQMWINGHQTVDIVLGSEKYKKLIEGTKFAKWQDFAAMPKGRFALQDHGEEVAFRTIRVKRLGEEK